jgi:hypothetical protein
MTNDFDYLAEEAKKDFNTNIGSLLELHHHFTQKINTANESKKDGQFLTINELEVLRDWITQAITGLSSNYDTLNRTNKLLNTNYRVVKALLRKTPTLKDMAA